MSEVTNYKGKCNQCNELYEAESSSEDLEGIIFRCKKFLCKGRVSLHYASAENGGPTSLRGSVRSSISSRRPC